ncbi:galactose mutarotase-like domain-containing protein [Phlebopus sp. FC_14]|nr:galactose mutarotase-like domain-containing protein [Phlebopus sp. FC_14]
MSNEFTPVLLSVPGSLTPPLAVEVLPHGVTLHRIIVQVDGKTHDIVVGPEDPKDHTIVKYTNTIIGRYANRIPAGKHVVERNGISSAFEALGNESPEVSLHGGPKGFDFGIWEQLKDLSDSELFTQAEIQSIRDETLGESSAAAIFKLVSEDGDQGYTGTLLLETLFVVLPPRKLEPSATSQHEVGSVVIVYRAKLVDVPEGGKQVTPVNLTQHWGFNLDASLDEGKDTLSVLNHDLTIKASHIAELLPNSPPSGKYIPVAEADNSSGAHIHDNKRIGDNFPGIGYDNYYLLSARPHLKLVSPHRMSISEFPSMNLVKDILTIQNDPVVMLSSSKSGLAVTFDTNQAGLMFYTSNHADESGYRKKIHGGTGLKGDGYIPGSAAFLEFHEPLSAFLYPTSTSTDTLLTSDEIYHNYVRADIIARPSETLE